MKRVLGLLVLCVVFSGSALTQESKPYPKFEVFGGYSFQHFDTEGVTNSTLNANCAAIPVVPPVSSPCFNLHPNLNGWNADLHYNITHRIGLQFDVSNHFGKPLDISSDALRAAQVLNVKGFPPRVTSYSFLGGPVISTRAEGFKPYIHWLIGVNHLSAATFQTGALGPPPSLSFSGTAFAMALGGGLDVNLSRRFSLRVVQIDYLLTFHNPNAIANSAFNTDFVSGIRTHQHNVRLSAGIVYSFGGRKGAPAPQHSPKAAPELQSQEAPPPSVPAPQSKEVSQEAPPPSVPAPQRQEAPPMTPPMLKPAALGISGDTDEFGGLRLADVPAGSAAAKAGLQKNDVILKVGQYEVHSVDDVARVVGAYASGTEIVVEYRYLGTPGIMRTKLVVP